MPGYAYMKVEGENQGEIKGASTAGGADKNEHIEVRALDHSLKREFSSKNPHPTGAALHKPMKITKEVDQASPLLAQAMADNEKFTKIEIKWFNATGDKYFTTSLENAYLVEMRTFKPDADLNPEIGSSPDLEECSFIYSKCTWTHDLASTSGSDDWEAE